jgi:hypothetical protein
MGSDRASSLGSATPSPVSCLPRFIP